MNVKVYCYKNCKSYVYNNVESTRKEYIKKFNLQLIQVLCCFRYDFFSDMFLLNVYECFKKYEFKLGYI